jgi:glutamate-1-semialdehyde aminotransferase
MTLSDRYRKSEALLERALRIIPLGAQTFSKSVTQYPRGVSPHFASRAKGARLWDVDGNEYIDFVNGLASVLLGYGDEDVDRAVREQLGSGVTFSLSHELEVLVAEQLVRLIPCAESVRFGKNGTDATSAAVRLARACTGRDRVAVCGYHGWQDWYIGTTTRDLGVPEAVRELSHKFPYGDLGALAGLFETHPGQFAAVVMEPMNAAWPPEGYLRGVLELTHSNGALLVFDETITGFRYHLGGAQALFGVTPDLATFGKGMANGFPLSAVVGREEVMGLMEEIFFSGTFGGETLSLAAAHAAISKLEREDVPALLGRLGEGLLAGLRGLIARESLGGLFQVSGHPSWSFLQIVHASESTRAEIKTLLLQELFARGFLCLGTHNLSAAHTERDVERLLECYAELLPWIGGLVRSGTLHEHLRTEVLLPLFQVR